jgi:hypothetical protein
MILLGSQKSSTIPQVFDATFLSGEYTFGICKAGLFQTDHKGWIIWGCVFSCKIYAVPLFLNFFILNGLTETHRSVVGILATRFTNNLYQPDHSNFFSLYFKNVFIISRPRIISHGTESKIQK